MAQDSFGTLLHYSTDNKVYWAVVGEVLSIDGPNQEAATIDTTTLNQAGAYRTFIGTVKDPGEMSFDCHLGATNIEALRLLLGTSLDWRITWVDAVTWCWDGVLTAFGVSAELESAVVASLTVKLSGAITVA